jgi:plasmid stability protein
MEEGANTMAQVLVRDVDPAVLEKLKARARNNHRSLEAELRVVLARAAEADGAGNGTHNGTRSGAPGSARVSATDVQAQVERVRALFAGRRFDDSADLLRADRDR